MALPRISDWSSTITAENEIEPESSTAPTKISRYSRISKNILPIKSDTTTLKQLYPHPESSTADNRYSVELNENLLSLLTILSFETEEDELESEFSSKFLLYAERYGDKSIEILLDLILGERVTLESASQALRWVGQIENSDWFFNQLRRSLLENCLLRSRFARVRYNAVLGLAYMDDPWAIPSIGRALENESIPSLRKDIGKVLAQLEATLQESE